MVQQACLSRRWRVVAVSGHSPWLALDRLGRERHPEQPLVVLPGLPPVRRDVCISWMQVSCVSRLRRCTACCCWAAWLGSRRGLHGLPLHLPWVDP